jgi:hypothetical protein
MNKYHYMTVHDFVKQAVVCCVYVMADTRTMKYVFKIFHYIISCKVTFVNWKTGIANWYELFKLYLIVCKLFRLDTFQQVNQGSITFLQVLSAKVFNIWTKIFWVWLLLELHISWVIIKPRTKFPDFKTCLAF